MTQKLFKALCEAEAILNPDKDEDLQAALYKFGSECQKLEREACANLIARKCKVLAAAIRARSIK